MLPESDPLPKPKPTVESIVTGPRVLTPERKPASNYNMSDALRPTPYHLMTTEEYEQEIAGLVEKLRDRAEEATVLGSNRPVTMADVLASAIILIDRSSLNRFDYEQFMTLKREADDMALTVRQMIEDGHPAPASLGLKTIADTFRYFAALSVTLRRDMQARPKKTSWWKSILGGLAQSAAQSAADAVRRDR
jgi:hypothetical protein